jgi:hypothetical protein
MDLTDRFLPIPGDNPDTHIDRNLPVIRNGISREALVLIAPVSVRASLGGISGRRVLKGFATPVFNIGDGIQMNLYLLQSGKRRLVGERFFDPGRRAEDRNWIPLSFPLEPDKDDLLEIKISAGPQGDLVADWLALSSLHLTQAEVAP